VASPSARRIVIAVWAAAAAVLLLTVALRLLDVEPLALHPIEYTPAALVALGLLVSFVGEQARSVLGMGYGTTATGILVALGLEPHDVIPAVLLLGLLPAAIEVGSHGWADPNSPAPSRRLISMVAILAVVGVVGAGLGAWAAVSISPSALATAIAAVLLALGLLAALKGRVSLRPRRGTLAAAVFGLVAGAGRGFMGGAYGPVMEPLDLETEDDEDTTRATLALPELLSCGAALAVFGVPTSPALWNVVGGLMVGSLIVKMMSALPTPAPVVRGAALLTSISTFAVAGLLILAAAS
jgi:uncharacterized membrane protein YfcA